MLFNVPALCYNGCVELSDIKLSDGRPAEMQQYISAALVLINMVEEVAETPAAE